MVDDDVVDGDLGCDDCVDSVECVLFVVLRVAFVLEFDEVGDRVCLLHHSAHSDMVADCCDGLVQTVDSAMAGSMTLIRLTESFSVRFAGGVLWTFDGF